MPAEDVPAEFSVQIFSLRRTQLTAGDRHAREIKAEICVRGKCSDFKLAPCSCRSCQSSRADTWHGCARSEVERAHTTLIVASTFGWIETKVALTSIQSQACESSDRDLRIVRVICRTARCYAEVQWLFPFMWDPHRRCCCVSAFLLLVAGMPKMKEQNQVHESVIVAVVEAIESTFWNWRTRANFQTYLLFINLSQDCRFPESFSSLHEHLPLHLNSDEQLLLLFFSPSIRSQLQPLPLLHTPHQPPNRFRLLPNPPNPRPLQPALAHTPVNLDIEPPG